MSVACAEAVLQFEGVGTSHAWEAKFYGAKKRGYGSGPKTRGSMARNRSGQVVVSRTRLADWVRCRTTVAQVAHSPLWAMLRELRMLSDGEYKALEPASRAAFHLRHCWIFKDPRSPLEEVARNLAACGTFDAVAALSSLLLEAENGGRPDLAFHCARHLPAAIALLGASPMGHRVALLILARLRQVCLDRMCWQGQRLALSDYDLPALRASAGRLPPLVLGHTVWREVRIAMALSARRETFVVGAFEVPASRAQWIRDALPPINLSPSVDPQRFWRQDLSPIGHPGSPCHPNAAAGFHPCAVARICETLGDYAGARNTHVKPTQTSASVRRSSRVTNAGGHATPSPA